MRVVQKVWNNNNDYNSYYDIINIFLSDYAKLNKYNSRPNN